MNPKVKKLFHWLGREVSSGFLNYWIFGYIFSGSVLVTSAIFWRQLYNAAIVLWQHTTSQWTWKEATIILDIVLMSSVSIFFLGIYFYKKRLNRKNHNPPSLNNVSVNGKSEKELNEESWKHRIRLLNNLSGGEKRVLRGYFERDSKSAMFEIPDGGIDGLVIKGILFNPNKILLDDNLMAYNIEEWAWEYLKTNQKLLE